MFDECMKVFGGGLARDAVESGVRDDGGVGIWTITECNEKLFLSIVD